MPEGYYTTPLRKAAIARQGSDVTVVATMKMVHEALAAATELEKEGVDVGLISLAKTLQTQNVPGKLLGYLHHGMPVLASINPGNDLQQLIEDRQAGFVSINGDDALFAQQARQLIADAALRKSMGRHGRRLLEDVFSVQQTVRQLLATVPQTAVAPQPQRRAA